MPPVDPVELAIFQSSFHSIADEMGAALRRTGFSPNIKERRDYSCALFNSVGEVFAMGDHMPVHLGSMPMSVSTVLRTLRLEKGDIALLNDPYAGGTHLPDLTMVMPVFVKGAKGAAFYIASRAHHADVGGMHPGSMGLCREIFQEGLRIPPVRIERRGRPDPEILSMILSNVRTPAEREGDLTAQIGSCRIGARRLQEITAKYGVRKINLYIRQLLDYSERLVQSELAALPGGKYIAEDFLDDDGISEQPVRIRVALSLDPRRRKAIADFSGTSPQVQGGINAVYAITWSAVFYVFRCLLREDAPATAGIMRPVQVHAPEGSVVNARPPAAVAGGNVETSQRIVDVLLRALAAAAPQRVPAASSGSMTNLTIGGIDPRTNRPFAYYETIAGGMGARPNCDGVSGIHTHMTNTLNTPAEALEYSYPLRVRRYAYRKASGGEGYYRGGDGLTREIEFLAEAQVNLLADRYRFAPYGLAGGEPGSCGRATMLRVNGSSELLSGKCNITAHPGDVLRVETPGSGGWGKIEGSNESMKRW
jgi:N-methylhydantoinase B